VTARAFVGTQPVRFQEIDAAGILYYPRFFDLYHRVFEDFFAAETGTPYHRFIGERRIGWPAVRSDGEFVAPLRFGDEARIELSFPELGRASVKCRYRAHRAVDGKFCAEATITVVTTDLEAMRAVPLPDEVRAAMARFGG